MKKILLSEVIDQCETDFIKYKNDVVPKMLTEDHWNVLETIIKSAYQCGYYDSTSYVIETLTDEI